MACLLKGGPKSKIKVTAVSSRTHNSIDRLKAIMGNDQGQICFTLDNVEAARRGNCILIATPDDQVKKVCSQVFDKIKLQKEKYVFYFSGSKPLEVVEPARKAGAFIGCMHPIKSFASPSQAAKTMTGTIFGLTFTEAEAGRVLKVLVEKLQGNYMEVKDSKKTLYHAACCVASNYLVALLDYSLSLVTSIGIEPGLATKALLSLSAGTLDNIEKLGTKKALTGPIARGDTGTIEEHLEQIGQCGCQKDIYLVMGKKSADIAYGNKWLSGEKYKLLNSILEDSPNHELKKDNH